MLKKLSCLLLGAIGIAQTAGAFSLIGLRPDWQTDRRGYSGDFGPMNIGEEYRWNVPTVYYGFDNSFLEYFGAKGVEEMDKAFQILNSLPSMSSARLDDFPFDIGFEIDDAGFTDGEHRPGEPDTIRVYAGASYRCALLQFVHHEEEEFRSRHTADIFVHQRQAMDLPGHSVFLHARPNRLPDQYAG
ncbi:MAG: hypothetical protein DME19_15400 [Verrucomicrobia bacterium]|nr:MAG: hypothetical protein DME19_15400 [Verrucomicrobiota bacterium]